MQSVGASRNPSPLGRGGGQLYTAVLQNGSIGSVMLDEWFPNDEDKQSVLVLLNKMESLLTECEKAILEQWKIKNLNYST